MDVDRGAVRVTGPRIPRVSIGMPVWNGEDSIREALDSLLAQEFEDFELLVSDNASTDTTAAICTEYMQKDSRIRLHRNERNIGLQANFRKVLTLATAPYFMWASHDDLWDPTYVARMVEVLDSEESVVVAGSNSDSIDEHGRPLRHFDNVRMYVQGSTYARACRLIRASPVGGHSTLIYGLMRTPVIARVGLVGYGRAREYDRGNFATDKLTLFRLLFEGEFRVAGETLYFHRDVVAEKHGDVPSVTARFARVVGHYVDVHGYYGAFRKIVFESSMEAHQKASLILVSVVQEARYYPVYAGSLLLRQVRRRVSRRPPPESREPVPPASGHGWRG